MAFVHYAHICSGNKALQTMLFPCWSPCSQRSAGQAEWFPIVSHSPHSVMLQPTHFVNLSIFRAVPHTYTGLCSLNYHAILWFWDPYVCIIVYWAFSLGLVYSFRVSDSSLPLGPWSIGFIKRMFGNWLLYFHACTRLHVQASSSLLNPHAYTHVPPVAVATLH